MIPIGWIQHRGQLLYILLGDVNEYSFLTKAFVILAARPCFDWRLKILTSVGSLATTDSIILRDGTTSEVEAQILLKFSGWISFVDKKLVQTLKDISEGNDNVNYKDAKLK